MRQRSSQSENKAFVMLEQSRCVLIMLSESDVVNFENMYYKSDVNVESIHNILSFTSM